ncbi:M48 family metalloprotease [Streptomyces sp. A012304]|uniref:M48 family metalloprotease n=1 Tax=Streptomyces sp. A012304 TaxID=375446 RepID=UPI002231E69B|nr:M48 family metalloprotease [Streptomyces sp. A012304]
MDRRRPSALREWSLVAAMLALAWLTRAVVLSALLLALLLWGPPWLMAGPLVLIAGDVARSVGGRGPLPGRAVRPADEPELAALVADVAERLGFREPLLVRIVPGVQAALGRTRVTGVRTRTLLLGLPLLRALTEAQLASVIAHELAHEQHIRDRRATALRSAHAMLAERLDGGLRPLAPLAARLLRASQPLLWQAETAADADAARVAGTAATDQALHATSLLDSAFDGLGDAWLSELAEKDQYPEDFYDALDTALGDPHVLRRAVRAAADEDALDPYAAADHPPFDRRTAALPSHTGAPYGAAPVPLRTAAAVERWCVRQLCGTDWERPEGEPDERVGDLRPVRLLDLPAERLHELGDGISRHLLEATRTDTPAEAVAATLDAFTDGTLEQLARRLEPGLRRAPATVRPALTRTVLAGAVGSPFAEVLRAAGWTYSSRWLNTVLTSPDDDGTVVDLTELVSDAVDSGDPGPLRALWASAAPKEQAV